MSVHFPVYLRDDLLPTREHWQQVLASHGVALVFDEFCPRTFSGHLPCRFNGVACGFEYYFDSVDKEADPELTDKIGNRDRVVDLVLHGAMALDSLAATYAAGALAEVADGLFLSGDSENAFVRSIAEVKELLRQSEEAQRERGRARAQKDAQITDRRCPQCGAPCPAYRKTCKACGSFQQ